MTVVWIILGVLFVINSTAITLILPHSGAKLSKLAIIALSAANTLADALLFYLLT